MIFPGDIPHREGIIHAIALFAHPIVPTKGLASGFEREHFGWLIWSAIVEAVVTDGYLLWCAQLGDHSQRAQLVGAFLPATVTTRAHSASLLKW